MCFRAGAVLVCCDSSEPAFTAVCDGPSVSRRDSQHEWVMFSDRLWQEAVAILQMPKLRHREAEETALKQRASQQVSGVPSSHRVPYPAL